MPLTSDNDAGNNKPRGLGRAVILAAGAAVSALQPPRLLLGTIGVAVIAIVGMFIDAIDSSYSMQGIDRPLTAEMELARGDELERIRRTLHESVRPSRTSESAPDIGELREALLATYHEQMASMEDDQAAMDLESNFKTGLARLDAFELQGPFSATMHASGRALGDFVGSIIQVEPGNALRALARLLYEIPAELWRASPIMAALIGLLLACSFGLFGGAIARLDALDTGLKRKETAWSGLEFAWLHIGRFLQSLLVPLGIVAVLTSALAILGIIFNLPVLDILGGVIYFIPLAFGILSALLLIGIGLLAPMLLGAVAVERSDAGDSIQRAWGAAMTRPAHLALLIGAALVSFAVSLAIVDLVVVLTIDIAASSWGGIISSPAVRDAGTYTLLDFNFGSDPDTSTGTAAIAGAFIGFWESLLTAIVLGYIFSWCATLGTRLFLGMRLLIDRQSTAVIWVPGSIGGTTVRQSGTVDGPFAADDTFEEGDR